MWLVVSWLSLCHYLDFCSKDTHYYYIAVSDVWVLSQSALCLSQRWRKCHSLVSSDCSSSGTWCMWWRIAIRSSSRSSRPNASKRAIERCPCWWYPMESKSSRCDVQISWKRATMRQLSSANSGASALILLYTSREWSANPPSYLWWRWQWALK